MLMLLIAELCCWGYKFHNKKSDGFNNTDKEFAYHVYMMRLYHDILKLTLDSDKLRKRYLQ